MPLIQNISFNILEIIIIVVYFKICHAKKIFYLLVFEIRALLCLNVTLLQPCALEHSATKKKNITLNICCVYYVEN